MFNRALFPAAFLLLTFLAASAQSAEQSGRVVAIADGDTFTLLTKEKDQIKIRVAEIDAPEAGQPFGSKSKQALSGLIFGQDVRVVVQKTDRYGRVVGRPYIGDLDVAREMIRIGAAWVYREYVTDRSLFQVEEDARTSGKGLWATTEAQSMSPWEWRRLGNREDAPEGCAIKGNINSKGERIYHAPGMRSYGATRIDTSKGERWFCSEAEAVRAGWRAPRG